MKKKKLKTPGQTVRVWLSDLGVVSVEIVEYNDPYYKVKTKHGKIYFVLATEIL